MSPTIERMLPLYEGKMIHHYDHRWATYDSDTESRDVTLDEKLDGNYVPLPRYWVRESLVKDRLGDASDADSLLGWRDITNITNERTMITAAFPVAGVGHTMPIAFPKEDSVLLQVIWSSFAFDFVARQKVGGTHMTYTYLLQLATPSPQIPVPWSDQGTDWLRARAAWLQSTGSWKRQVRPTIRAELDAAMFHIYGVCRDDVDYIMETFPIVKRKDIAEFGHYRTKDMILNIYDQLAAAIETGVPYESPFDELDAPAGS